MASPAVALHAAVAIRTMDLHRGEALAPLLTSAYAAPEDDGPKAEDRGPERGKEPRSAPPV